MPSHCLAAAAANCCAAESAAEDWIAAAAVAAELAVMVSLGRVSFLGLVSSQLTGYPSCWKQDFRMENCRQLGQLRSLHKNHPLPLVPLDLAKELRDIKTVASAYQMAVHAKGNATHDRLDRFNT